MSRNRISSFGRLRQDKTIGMVVCHLLVAPQPKKRKRSGEDEKGAFRRAKLILRYRPFVRQTPVTTVDEVFSLQQLQNNAAPMASWPCDRARARPLRP